MSDEFGCLDRGNPKVWNMLYNKNQQKIVSGCEGCDEKDEELKNSEYSQIKTPLIELRFDSRSFLT